MSNPPAYQQQTYQPPNPQYPGSPQPQYAGSPQPQYAQQGQYAQPVQYVMSPAPQVVVVNPAMVCPGGGAHFITSDFSCCGIAMAIIFFPIGVLCCLAMREQRCAKCGMSFGDGC